MRKRIFSCTVCGQVYHYFPPEECLRLGCNSMSFERIKKRDVIDMHDVFDIFISKLIKGDYIKKMSEFKKCLALEKDSRFFDKFHCPHMNHEKKICNFPSESNNCPCLKIIK